MFTVISLNINTLPFITLNQWKSGREMLIQLKNAKTAMQQSKKRKSVEEIAQSNHDAFKIESKHILEIYEEKCNNSENTVSLIKLISG